MNYSFESKDALGKGLSHNGKIDRENIILLPNALLRVDHEQENEVWVKGEEANFKPEDLRLYGADDAEENVGDIVKDEGFIEGDFSAFNNDTLEELGKQLFKVYSKDKHIKTDKGVTRVESLYEEIKSRSVLDENDIFTSYSTRESPEEIIEEITLGKASADTDFEFKTDFDQTEVINRGRLSSYGFKNGASSAHMEVLELPSYNPDNNKKDGLAIQTDYSKGAAESELGEREVLTYSAVQEITKNEDVGESVPTHKHGSDIDWVAKEVTDGELASDISEELAEEVSVDEFINKASLQVMAGNWDAHSDNVYVTEDGKLQFIDLDHGAGTLDNPSAGQKSFKYDDALDRTVGELWESFKALGLDQRVAISKSEFRKNLLDSAQSKSKTFYDPESGSLTLDGDVLESELIVQSDSDSDIYKNIMQNIKDLANGEYE